MPISTSVRCAHVYSAGHHAVMSSVKVAKACAGGTGTVMV